MNRVLIYGGLGNQMFQYALNTALNQKGRKSKILFSNFFYDDYHNGFNLKQAFKLKLPFPSVLYSFILMHGGLLYKNKIAAYFFRKLITKYRKKKYTIYTEKVEFLYDETVFHKTSSLLIGVWQVEAYFKDISEIIRREFLFKKPKDARNRKLIQEINTCNSVSIHIRRGDYLTSKRTELFTVFKNETYYINAIDYINKRIENPHYYIFSDDIQWVKENLKIANCTFVDHNKGKNSYIDMYLMSLCKHNIIANSTFSWWGGWLNNNKNKMVIIPECWLNTKDCPGIYPSEWIKMGV